MKPSPSDAGFTLIEVLVAFVIVTLGLVTFYRAVGDGFRQSQRAASAEEAMVSAQNHLAGLDVTRPMSETEGRYANGAKWRLGVSRHGNSTLQEVGTSEALLISLTVRDIDNRVITQLETIRLVRRTP